MNLWEEFRKKKPLYRINRPWIVDLRVLHGLGGVAYYGTLPEFIQTENIEFLFLCLNFE